MIEYVSDALVAEALEVGRIPDNAFTSAKLLGACTRALKSYIAPLIVGTRQDFYSVNLDFALSGSASATYRVPSRAVGGAVRELSFLDASGNVIDVPRIAIDDLAQASWGFVLQGASVRYVNRIADTTAVTGRMTFDMTPARLCAAAEAARVVSVAGSVITLEQIPEPASPLQPEPSVRAPASWTSPLVVDFIRSTPGFETYGIDVPATLVGTTLTVTGAGPCNFDPSSVLATDYVALARYAPVPQVPEELFPLLAQRVAVDLLMALGDAEGAKSAAGILSGMQEAAKAMTAERTPGAPIQLIPRGGIFTATRRW